MPQCVHVAQLLNQAGLLVALPSGSFLHGLSGVHDGAAVHLVLLPPRARWPLDVTDAISPGALCARLPCLDHHHLVAVGLHHVGVGHGGRDGHLQKGPGLGGVGLAKAGRQLDHLISHVHAPPPPQHDLSLLALSQHPLYLHLLRPGHLLCGLPLVQDVKQHAVELLVLAAGGGDPHRALRPVDVPIAGLQADPPGWEGEFPVGHRRSHDVGNGVPVQATLSLHLKVAKHPHEQGGAACIRELLVGDGDGLQRVDESAHEGFL
mmetsp:Transcript_27322/g.77104  ORF Transcript_27322/g.77104 Transcript_27322/m.77104 type:complete len:263 (-) Transcript_27322:3008-3796(-)